jgi:hypothetical protein
MGRISTICGIQSPQVFDVEARDVAHLILKYGTRVNFSKCGIFAGSVPHLFRLNPQNAGRGMRDARQDTSLVEASDIFVGIWKS